MQIKAKRTTRALVALVASLAALLVGAGINANTASASAYGCTGYGAGVTWQGMYVKNGTWCGSINGSGTYVNWVGGNFYSHIPGPSAVCNFRERVEFYDASGRYYAYAQSATFYRCSAASDLPTMYIRRYMQRGFVLFKLQSNGSTVATVRENIY